MTEKKINKVNLKELVEILEKVKTNPASECGDTGCWNKNLPLLETSGLVASIVYYTESVQEGGYGLNDQYVRSACEHNVYRGMLTDKSGLLVPFKRVRTPHSTGGKYQEFISQNWFWEDVNMLEAAKNTGKLVTLRGFPFCGCREEDGLYIKLTKFSSK